MKYLLYTHKRAKSDILRATEHSRWLSIASLDTAYSINSVRKSVVSGIVTLLFHESSNNRPVIVTGFEMNTRIVLLVIYIDGLYLYGVLLLKIYVTRTENNLSNHLDLHSSELQ